MNAKEARTAFEINHPEKTNDMFRLNLFWEARGYLDALKGPELKVLVDFIEAVEHGAHPRWRKAAKVALSQFREAVK